MASAAPAAASGSADYSYPAVDLDGRKKIMISWKQGDDPVQVAQAFARQHGYAAGPIGGLTRFVQAMQVPASECGHALILFSLEFHVLTFFMC